VNRFFSNKKLIVLLISVIVLISLLSLSITQTNTNFVQSFTNDVTAFVGRAFSKPVDAVLDTYDTVSNVQDTFEENQRLKSEVDELSQTESEIRTLTDENQRLREELNLQDSITDYDSISGNVISRNPDYWVDQVTTDLGSQDGIALGMPVMSGNGLIGQISEVNLTSSKVTLLTNIDESANQVSAEIVLDSEDSNEVIHGVVSGYDPNREMIIMDQITSESEINEGDTVTTSGLGGSYPRGLEIGTVNEVTVDNQGLTQEVYLEPAADFNNIRVVSVINRQAQVVGSDDSEEENQE